MADSTTEPEFQRATEEFVRTLEELLEMEVEKRTLEPSDPRRLSLAVQVEELTLGLLGRSHYQTSLVAEGQPAAVSDPRHPHLALADWRDAERRLREAHLMVQRIGLESVRFQDEYRRSVARVDGQDG